MGKLNLFIRVGLGMLWMGSAIHQGMAQTSSLPNTPVGLLGSLAATAECIEPRPSLSAMACEQSDIPVTPSGSPLSMAMGDWDPIFSWVTEQVTGVIGPHESGAIGPGGGGSLGDFAGDERMKSSSTLLP